jgi:hypothetical protein
MNLEAGLMFDTRTMFTSRCTDIAAVLLLQQLDRWSTSTPESCQSQSPVCGHLEGRS